jgi:hypothetical protein
MQHVQVARWEHAAAVFRHAFYVGYTDGKRSLADKTSRRLVEVESVFYVDVRREHILGGEWRIHVARFEHAGRVAALAARRCGEAKLDETQAHPNADRAAVTHYLRWMIVLNP